MLRRLVSLGACFLLTAGYLSINLRSEPAIQRASFAEFPTRIAEWSGLPTASLDPEVARVLGVDDYVNRYYASGRRLAHLYVGYYKSQREGDTIHSPMNCLPGAGWQPISAGTIELHAGRVPIHVNRFVIQKGLDRQIVLYWYESHGRAIASDYVSKIYLVLDSIRLNRTDAALVRVIAPFDDRSLTPDTDAEATAVDFVKASYPLLGRYLPS